jgi:hypothetical protein
MVNTTTAIEKERPFKPSWIDHFNNWVEKLSVPSWVFYVVLGIGLILVQILFLWLDNGMQSEDSCRSSSSML